MLKLFCDKCGKEITDTEYRSLRVDSSLMPKGKDEDSENLEYELCVPCHDTAMLVFQTAIKNLP